MRPPACAPSTYQRSAKRTFFHMHKSIAQALEPLGLLLRGGMHVAPGDKVPALPDGSAAQTLLLVGNAGPALWRAFSASPEYSDGQAHPLNRWTRRQLDAVAGPFGVSTQQTPLDPTPTAVVSESGRWRQLGSRLPAMRQQLRDHAVALGR